MPGIHELRKQSAEREHKGIKPYGESHQYVQTGEHRRMSKILNNG
jgi:hypothetical protein